MHEVSLILHYKDVLLATKQGVLPVDEGAAQLETAIRNFLE